MGKKKKQHSYKPVQLNILQDPALSYKSRVVLFWRMFGADPERSSYLPIWSSDDVCRVIGWYDDAGNPQTKSYRVVKSRLVAQGSLERVEKRTDRGILHSWRACGPMLDEDALDVLNSNSTSVEYVAREEIARNEIPEVPAWTWLEDAGLKDWSNKDIVRWWASSFAAVANTKTKGWRSEDKPTPLERQTAVLIAVYSRWEGMQGVTLHDPPAWLRSQINLLKKSDLSILKAKEWLKRAGTGTLRNSYAAFLAQEKKKSNEEPEIGAGTVIGEEAFEGSLDQFL